MKVEEAKRAINQAIGSGPDAFAAPGPQAVRWTRDRGGLVIDLSERPPCEHAVAFRITPEA